MNNLLDWVSGWALYNICCIVQIEYYIKNYAISWLCTHKQTSAVINMYVCMYEIGKYETCSIITIISIIYEQIVEHREEKSQKIRTYL